MHEATFRFFGPLAFHLEAGRRHGPAAYRFRGRPAVRDAIEAQGVPHTEVDLIRVDQQTVAPHHPLNDGAYVTVYPRFRQLRPDADDRLLPNLPRPPAFVLDVHLGRLARYLRLLGFDTRWDAHADDAALAACSARERRVLLTRDRGLLKRSAVWMGGFVRATHPRRQLREVAARFELAAHVAPFTRCMVCNGELEAVPKCAVADQLPPHVAAHVAAFRRCRQCAQVYWQGSHVQRMQSLVDAVRAGRADRTNPDESLS